jgi:5S rRNA maturation endonuclease (ribonuclease M5)
MQPTSCPFCLSGNVTGCFVEYDDGGYFCFTCKASKGSSVHSDFIPKRSKYRNLQLPDDIEWNPKRFSSTALKWLYQYYLDDKDIKENQIGYISRYSDSRGISLNDCIVFLDKNFFVVRSLTKKDFRIIGDKSLPQVFKYATLIHEGTIIICEDYISAVRCSRIANAIALWGTSISYETLQAIKYKYSNFIIWLDGDDAGQKGANIIQEKLYRELVYFSKAHSFNKKVYNIRNIKTEKDPKCYSPSELKNIIER